MVLWGPGGKEGRFWKAGPTSEVMLFLWWPEFGTLGGNLSCVLPVPTLEFGLWGVWRGFGEVFRPVAICVRNKAFGDEFQVSGLRALF